jgi:hypothetical protein
VANARHGIAVANDEKARRDMLGFRAALFACGQNTKQFCGPQANIRVHFSDVWASTISSYVSNNSGQWSRASTPPQELPFDSRQPHTQMMNAAHHEPPAKIDSPPSGVLWQAK